MGHYDIRNIQKIMPTKGLDTKPILIPTQPGTATYIIPLYHAFLRRSARQILLHSTHVTHNVEHSEVIKEGDLLPEKCISTDQYECRIK